MMCRCLQNLTQLMHSLAADVLRCTGADFTSVRLRRYAGRTKVLVGEGGRVVQSQFCECQLDACHANSDRVSPNIGLVWMEPSRTFNVHLFKRQRKWKHHLPCGATHQLLTRVARTV